MNVGPRICCRPGLAPTPSSRYYNTFLHMSLLVSLLSVIVDSMSNRPCKLFLLCKLTVPFFQTSFCQCLFVLQYIDPTFCVEQCKTLSQTVTLQCNYLPSFQAVTYELSMYICIFFPSSCLPVQPHISKQLS